MARPATAAVRLLAGSREPCRVATTVPIGLSTGGLLTIDGVTVAAGDRVLVKNQLNDTENGIYIASAGEWYRASDANYSRAINKGVTVHVRSGTVHGGQVFAFQTADPDIGTDDILITFFLSDDTVAGADQAIAALRAAAEAEIGSVRAEAVGVILGYASDYVSQGNVPLYATKVGMSGLTVPVGINAVRVNGHSVAGDGGEALYTTTDNGAQGQFTDAGARTFYIANKKLTPRMYGAQSNGSDSLAAFTAWAADVSAGLGWGSVDRESYHVSDGIVFTGTDIVVEHNGVITQTGVAKETFNFSSIEGLKVFGGSLIGKGTEFVGGSTTYNGAAGIYLDACSDVTIDGVRLSNHAGGGVRWGNILLRATLANITSQGIGSGLISPGDNGNDVGIGGHTGDGDQGIAIVSPKIYDHAFGIFAYDCTDLTILDPLIFDIVGQHGIYLSEVPSYTIRGGRIERCGLEGIKSQIAKDVDLPGPCIIDGVTIIDVGQHGVVVDTIPTYTATRRHADVSLSNITVRNPTGLGVTVTETLRLSASNIDVVDAGSYGMLLDKVGGSISGFTAERTDLSGLFINSSVHEMGGLHLRDIRLIDTVLNTVAGASSQHVYPFYAELQSSTLPLTIDGLDIEYTGAEPASLSKAFRLQTNVVADVRRLTDRTTKGWQIATAPTHFGLHVSSAGETTAGVLNPTTPISGHGRREYYGTQDPATAGMVRAFVRGDICWNATPSSAGYVGWVCTASGSPGTWLGFGVIA